MLEVNIYEAKNRLSELLAAVERGEGVRICRNGTPIAELRALPQARNPLDEESPLRAVAGTTADRRAVARMAREDDPELGSVAWGVG